MPTIDCFEQSQQQQQQRSNAVLAVNEEKKASLLFNRLLKIENNQPESKFKIQALALTIQSMCAGHFGMLVKLFEFYVEQRLLEMCADIFENLLFKNFDLLNNAAHANLFDKHTDAFTVEIIRQLSPKRQSVIGLNQTGGQEKENEFYFQVFLKMSQSNQDKFVGKVVERLVADLSLFLKVDANAAKALDIPELYASMGKHRSSVFKLRDLLLVYKNFIPEYGLHMNDSFLNVEKTIYQCLVTQSGLYCAAQFDADVLSVERRALNVTRRLCVLEFMPEFLQLIDKLDNRHCYRWIEKSLEFFTKYALCSTVVTYENDKWQFDYSTYKLLNDCELLVGEAAKSRTSQENEAYIKQIRQSLSEELTVYRFAKANTVENSPFYHVYSLLDGIGKKLDWPPISATSLPGSSQFLKIEDKINLLFMLKSKLASNDPGIGKLQISAASLNKQISFYGIAYFFHKLSEFSSLSKAVFPRGLVLVSERFSAMSGDQNQQTAVYANDTQADKELKGATVLNLVLCLKLWEKFVQHKEILTILTKCLSNTKLDSISCYKLFQTEYFNYGYSLALNNPKSIANTLNWTSLSTMFKSCKQKIPVIAYLFMNEKKSFETFFRELKQILIVDLEKETNSSEMETDSNNENNVPAMANYYDQVQLSKMSFNLFELSKESLLRYFSGLVIEKLAQLTELKKSSYMEALTKNDNYIGLILVLVQFKLESEEISSAAELYDLLIKVIKSKASFEYNEFFSFIYDVRILQDFCELKSSQLIKRFKLTAEEAEESWTLDEFKARVHAHLNRSDLRSRKFELLENFFAQNCELFISLFNRFL